MKQFKNELKTQEKLKSQQVLSTGWFLFVCILGQKSSVLYCLVPGGFRGPYTKTVIKQQSNTCFPFIYILVTSIIPSRSIAHQVYHYKANFYDVKIMQNKVKVGQSDCYKHLMYTNQNSNVS